MWISKKKIQRLIFFLPILSLGICNVAWAFSEEREDYHLEREGSIYRVSTELETPATAEDIEICFSAPDGTDACFPFCDVDGETVTCTVRHPLFAPVYRDRQFRFRYDLDNQLDDYSPYMTVQQLQSQMGLTPEQLERIALLWPGSYAGGGEPPPDDPPSDDPPPPPDSIPCAEACEVGYFCNTEIGQCEVVPDENLCEDVVCDSGQACDTDTGACVDEEEDPEGGGNRPPGTDRRDDDNEDPPGEQNPLACAYNPSQCADTKGWCSLNPEAEFNPFVFVFLIFSLLGLMMRVAKNRGPVRKFLSVSPKSGPPRTKISCHPCF